MEAIMADFKQGLPAPRAAVKKPETKFWEFRVKLNFEPNCNENLEFGCDFGGFVNFFSKIASRSSRIFFLQPVKAPLSMGYLLYKWKKTIWLLIKLCCNFKYNRLPKFENNLRTSACAVPPRKKDLQ